MEDEVGACLYRVFFPSLELNYPGLTQGFLNLLEKHHILWLSGHDHIISRSLIFAQGANVDTQIHYHEYENPEKKQE